MTVVGLITEYNPFHKGHKYHIDKAKKITGADYAVVIMSGNYVQRGTPSFIDKYTKTQIALNNGADLIIELPYCFACSSAEYFAYSAVSILDKLNIIDYICFGAENDDISLLYQIAKILVDEPSEYTKHLKELLKTGLPFPLARAKALKHYTIENSIFTDFDETLIQSPNNILGIEYIKALIKRKSSIKPVTLKRIEADYHDTDVDKRFFSATAIRCSDNILDTLKEIDTSYCESYQKTFPLVPNDFSNSLGYALLTHKGNNSLYDIFGISKDFQNKIENQMYQYKDFLSFAQLLKSKELVLTHINRGLLHVLLNITKQQIDEYLGNDIADFIRVLGFNTSATCLLTNISKKSDMAIITKMADSKKTLTNLPSHNTTLFNNWLFADNLYRQTALNKFEYISSNEFTMGIKKTSTKVDA